MNEIDVLIIGAGAAGLMCAIEAGKRKRRVLILEKSNKVGKKILMSGGGRCNFTNLYISPERYVSHNKHFCKSALSRYTQWDFIALVKRHRIAYFEKTAGQLFCENRSQDIVNLLLNECKTAGVTIQLKQTISSVEAIEKGFLVRCQNVTYRCQSLVVATGGLSIPTLGSSPFGYQLAEQFGLPVRPLRAGLVPFTLHDQDKARLEKLAGVSVMATVHCNGQSFSESLLFTHRGLSGPAILQLSSYWYPGDEVMIHLLPEVDIQAQLIQARQHQPEQLLKTTLGAHLPKRLLSVFFEEEQLNKPLKQFNYHQLEAITHKLTQWIIKPNATEGYRTAEVTLGGVDCHALSSQRLEAREIPGLFFIGEVLDVSGWLGGYNFQWAWSSGWAAGQVV